MIKNLPISFGANLVVSPDIYQKLSPQDAGELKDTLGRYKSFLDLPKVKQMSLGDTVTISKAKAPKGKYAFKVDFSCSSNPDVSLGDAGVYNASSPKSLSLGVLILQTLQFLCNKYDTRFFGMENPEKTVQGLIEKFNSLQDD